MTSRDTPAPTAATTSNGPLSSSRTAPAHVPPMADVVPLLLPVMAALDEIRAEVKRANAITEVLLGRLTDHSHLTLREIAQLQGISESAARRRYGKHLEVIPDTRRRGVPRQRVLDGWVPAKTVRTANRKKGAA